MKRFKMWYSLFEIANQDWPMKARFKRGEGARSSQLRLVLPGESDYEKAEYEQPDNLSQVKIDVRKEEL